MNSFRRLIAVGLAAASLSVTLAASAQPKTEAPASAYTYDFEPDDLIGETLSTTPPLLRVRPKALRVMLLRPRASFVGEMLKSVEVL